MSQDYRELARALEIFHIDPQVGKGLVLWLPNGAIVRDQLEAFARELEFKANYKRVYSPHIAREQLYQKSGHLPYFDKHMYPSIEILDDNEGVSSVKDVYRLRPMNCPHHHCIFGSKPRSYRELPLRLAEYGQVYRFEDSGALNGLMRARGLCQNDAHIYCSQDQVESEVASVIDMYRHVYEILGISNFRLRLSTWDPSDPEIRHKYVDRPELWEVSQNILRRVLQNSKLDFDEASGEAAFYGPKIDVQMPSVLGKSETASTIQIDFAQAERMGLSYHAANGSQRIPWIVHRAPLGSHERMVALLLELYQGHFPLWLAPAQVKLIAVSPSFDDACASFANELRNCGIRADFENSSESLGKQVRRAQLAKIPMIGVIGKNEVSQSTVSLRFHGSAQGTSLTRSEFVRRLLLNIERRDRAWSP